MSFPTTHWPLVDEATLTGDTVGRTALATMCQSYHKPVFVVLRSRGIAEPDAEDMTQEFFLKVLDQRAWKRADRGKGKFRTFLITVLLNMLSKSERAKCAQKRGGDHATISLETLTANGFEPTTPHDETLRLFDREWAIGLLQASVHEVEQEFHSAGKTAEFEVLKRFLPGAHAPLQYDEAALLLGKSTGAVKSEVCRLRSRMREALRSNIARTVSAAHEIDDEMAHLFAVLQ